MNLYISPYQLHPTNLKGVLIRCDWGNQVGYADLFAWEKWGDLPVEVQINNLKKNNISLQLHQSIAMAAKDAQARNEKRNLLESCEKIKNNYLIANATEFDVDDLKKIKLDGFKTVKIKVGLNADKEIHLIEKASLLNFKIRLDFIAETSYEEFENFISHIPKKILEFIEYFEDPCTFNANDWRKAQRFCPIAIDHSLALFKWPRESLDWPFNAIVVKPAKVNFNDLPLKNIPTTITSYMDHPVGQMHALAVAIEFKEKYPHQILDSGCLTHHLFETNAYSDLIQQNGPFIKKIEGYGIGFDHLLKNENWQWVAEL